METQNNNANASANTNSTTSVVSGEKGKNTLMGVLAYLGPLVIVSYLVAKDDPFVKFHIKQGLVLFCIEVIIAVLMPMFPYSIWRLMDLLNLATLVLAVIGIVNVVQGKEKNLPLVGNLTSHFKF